MKGMRMPWLLTVALRLWLFACALLPYRVATGQQAASELSKPWWKNAVFYEVYVQSFQDTNGDGIGDLRGVIKRLDYLQQLGVDAIWLTPIFPSPQADSGYDVADYESIDPRYGTVADLDALIAEAKQRHIRVLLDLVLNHTSDQHPWFQASRHPNSPKRDWYIWRDGQRGAGTQPAPPNNWLDRTGRPAWQYDALSGQFFYHYFAPQQPDLNWRNPAVEAAMFQGVDFWLKRGIAGFRLDAVPMLFEDVRLQNEPTLPGSNEYGEQAQSQQFQRNLPEVHDVLKDLRREVDRSPGSPVLIGEIYTSHSQDLLPWYGTDGDELQLPMNTGVGFLNNLDPAQFRQRLSANSALPAGDTPLLVSDNHDQRRSMDRYGDGQYDTPIAKILATILLGSRGSALLYQGQEIGMRTSQPQRKEDLRDPRGIAGWPREKGRDGERTPMQWKETASMGFSSGTPWLALPPAAPTATVAREIKEPASLLHWYTQLIAFRRSSEVMRSGTQLLLNFDATGVLGWTWHAEGQASAKASDVVFLCNLTNHTVAVNVAALTRSSDASYTRYATELDTAANESFASEDLSKVKLTPFEVKVGRLVREH